MRTPNRAFRNRLIALSICLCGLLAFSTTLSADTTNFVIGVANLGTYTPTVTGGIAEQIGPYPGTLTIVTGTGSTVSPNSLFFCLTGNQNVDAKEYGNVTTPLQATSPLKEEEEQAAFLASLMLTEPTKNGVTVTTSGSLGSKYVVLTGGNYNAFITAIAPIETAIWYIMGTLPSQDAALAANLNLDSKVKALVTLAQANYMNYSYNNVQVFNFIPNSDPNHCQPYGQSFISVTPLTPLPEPGTVVLFGTGSLLVALGCARRRLARRPR